MCAISGMIGLSWEEETIQEMMETMRRRGPDGNGVYQGEEVLLLHTRLAIIDPAGGAQPMIFQSPKETYVLTYNGELYNTQEIRQELMTLGHQFEGHSDTEVVLHAYAQYGEGCVERFNGIFALAVWECKRKRLFLARDRIGVKPLFYTQMGQGIAFASEIKTLLRCPGVSAKLDRTGAAQLILLGPGRYPGSGVLQGIQEVEPGYCGYFESGKLVLRQYWKLRDREHTVSFLQTSETVGWLVRDAIQRQMVADVPVGTFLSGGLDSSIITAVCAQKMEENGEKLKTFSVDYRDSERYFRANKFQPDSDNDYIRLMVERFRTKHQWTMLSSEELEGVLEEATIARDLPGMADVDFSLLAFCGEIRKEVKVALSGECADEIFGGYPWYRDPEVRAREGFPWAQNTRQRSEILAPGIVEDANGFVMEGYLQTCWDSDILPGTSPEERRMKEMVNLNFRWFMQTLLDRKDRMSMYHGLEVRVPFCDYRIAEYLYGVPWEMKNVQGREKGLLRHSVEGLLPADVLYRKKSPYPKTFDPEYEAIMQKRLERLLNQDRPIWHMVNREKLRQWMTKDSQWPWYGQLMRRAQTMAYFVQLDFWLEYNDVEFCF